MSIYKKVQAVEKIFHQLEKDVATFQEATDLKCQTGCGLCCRKPDISATILEFIPFAYYLYKNDEAEKWYERMLTLPDETLCVNLNSFLTANSSGFCANYNHRGLICRVFGFSASNDQMGHAKLVTCKTIKSEFPDAVAKANEHIKSKKPTPLISNYYSQLRGIDADLGGELLPINKAILEAIKTVLAYYTYRTPRKAS